MRIGDTEPDCGDRCGGAGPYRTADESGEHAPELLFQGLNQYLEVLRTVHLIAVAQNTENTIRMQLRLEDERVQRGSGIAVDVLQAKSRLQVAKE